MKLNDNIKLIRLHLGITQEQLAHDLGIIFSTINRWENGRTVPSKLAKLRFLAYCSQNNIDDSILKHLKNT